MTTVAQARSSLTSNDAAVLQALFDAESSPSSSITIDSTLSPWPATVNIPQEDLDSLKTREVEIIRKIQSDNATEATILMAVEELDTLLDQYPTYPSAYTNRAQSLRILAELQSKPQHGNAVAEDVLFTPQAADLSTRIFADLGQAIVLATPISPADPVSSVQARLLADAHTHRGYLLLRAARLKQNQNELKGLKVGPERLRGLNADELEEMASRDFFLGGRYGNKAAQQLAVQTNPYAKMCGGIVKEAMRKEVEG